MVEKWQGKRVKLNPKRVFSEEFQKAQVNEFEKGEFTTQEIAKLCIKSARLSARSASL